MGNKSLNEIKESFKKDFDDIEITKENAHKFFSEILEMITSIHSKCLGYVHCMIDFRLGIDEDRTDLIDYISELDHDKTVELIELSKED